EPEPSVPAASAPTASAPRPSEPAAPGSARLTTETGPDGAGAAEGASKTRRPVVLAFLMTTMALGSIEGTIVATAMPSIVSTLGGFELFSWVFSAYLLTQAVFTPISGSLSDALGRKPVLLASIALFLLASIACGFAGTMQQLIAFRLVQG